MRNCEVAVRECYPRLTAEVIVIRCSRTKRPLFRPPYNGIKHYGVAARALWREPQRHQNTRRTCMGKARLNSVKVKGSGRSLPPRNPHRAAKQRCGAGYGIASDESR